jgi:hypothetical protein
VKSENWSKLGCGVPDEHPTSRAQAHADNKIFFIIKIYAKIEATLAYFKLFQQKSVGLVYLII